MFNSITERCTIQALARLLSVCYTGRLRRPAFIKPAQELDHIYFKTKEAKTTAVHSEEFY